MSPEYHSQACVVQVPGVTFEESEGEVVIPPTTKPGAGAVDQVAVPLPEFTFTGDPAGGTVTVGVAFKRNDISTVTVNTANEDTIAQVVSRLNTAINGDGNGGLRNLRTIVKEGDPATFVEVSGPPEENIFMSTTDSGLNMPPAVGSLTAVVSKTNNTAIVSWSLPAGVTYDHVILTKNADLGRDTILDGSTTSYTDDEVRTEGIDPPWQEYDLQYRVVGWKDGLPSDLAQVDVYESLRITTADLPAAQVGVAYSVALATSGGVPPVTWSLDAGSSLPDGISFSPTTGTVSGTPTAAGTFYFGVGVADSQAPPSEAGRNYKLVVNP